MCVLGWWGVALSLSYFKKYNLSRFRNVIKGVACVQTSVPLRNAIKISCLQKVVYTYVSLSFSALAVLAASL